MSKLYKEQYATPGYKGTPVTALMCINEYDELDVLTVNLDTKIELKENMVFVDINREFNPLMELVDEGLAFVIAEIPSGFLMYPLIIIDEDVFAAIEELEG